MALNKPVDLQRRHLCGMFWLGKARGYGGEMMGALAVAIRPDRRDERTGEWVRPWHDLAMASSFARLRCACVSFEEWDTSLRAPAFSPVTLMTHILLPRNMYLRTNNSKRCRKKTHTSIILVWPCQQRICKSLRDLKTIRKGIKTIEDHLFQQWTIAEPTVICAGLVCVTPRTVGPFMKWKIRNLICWSYFHGIAVWTLERSAVNLLSGLGASCRCDCPIWLLKIAKQSVGLACVCSSFFHFDASTSRPTRCGVFVLESVGDWHV